MGRDGERDGRSLHHHQGAPALRRVRRYSGTQAPQYRAVLRPGRGRQDPFCPALYALACCGGDDRRVGTAQNFRGANRRRPVALLQRLLHPNREWAGRRAAPRPAPVHGAVEWAVKRHLTPPDETIYISGRYRSKFVELVIIDEAERLSNNALEWVRDLFDRNGIGLILIGMPSIEKRLSRYPQLYSRVGFAHRYRPLGAKELAFVLTRRWRELGLDLNDADFTDAHAVAAIVRITGGNFRLVQRLFVQIGRILQINELTSITEEVVEAARSTLVMGTG